MDSSRGHRPPNLRTAGEGEKKACANCAHFKDRWCQLHQWPVRPFHVCDTWEPRRG